MALWSKIPLFVGLPGDLQKEHCLYFIHVYSVAFTYMYMYLNFLLRICACKHKLTEATSFPSIPN